MMGYGKSIEVTIEEGTVAVRDYGRGGAERYNMTADKEFDEQRSGNS